MGMSLVRPGFEQSERPESPAEHPMSSAVVPVSEIDRLIAEAHRDLGAARSAFARSPSGAAATACQAAEARLDELLDVRLERTTTSSWPAAAGTT
jgi:hypothetical protein